MRSIVAGVGTAVVVTMLLVSILASGGALAASPTASPSPTPTRSDGHTLVVTQVNGSVGYTMIVTGTVTLRQTEAGDAIAGQTVTGRVGGYPWNETASDSKDVIYFTGELQNFEYNGGTIRVRRDGELVDPSALKNTPAPIPSMTPVPSPPRQSPSLARSPTPIPVASVGLPSTTVAPPPSPPTSSPSGSSLPSLGWLETVVLGLVVVLALAGVGVLLASR